MTTQTFDIQAAIQALRDGKGLTGKDGILTLLIKQLTEAAMQAELEQHLEQDETPNRKNGSSSKTVKSPAGSFELNTPRVSVHFRTSYSHLRSRDKLCTHHNRRVIWQSELTATRHNGSN